MIKQITNPIMEEQLAIFRDKNSSVQEVNKAVDLISIYLAGETSKLLEVKNKIVETPLGMADGVEIIENIELIPIARAGLAMLPAFEKLLPCCHVGLICASRNVDLSVNILYNKMSTDLSEKTAIILDTMLATGSTINKVISIAQERNCKKIIVVCVLATPLGIENIEKRIDVPIVAVGINERLDSKNYVYPGVGDSGDRLFGEN